MPCRMKTRTITREEALALITPPPAPTDEELAALRALLSIAATDTGQARRVANFLLAWWNSVSCGGFDLTDLWAVDRVIADYMLTVVGMIARVHEYPDKLGFRAEFERVIADWRPHLLSE